MFTTIRRYDRMRTLQDLCESNMPLYTSPAMLILLGADTIDESTSNTMKTILKHVKLYPEDPNFRADPVTTATLQRRSDINLEIIENYTDKDGRPFLYVIDECFCNLYLSYIVKSEFLFTSQIRGFMMRMVEAGLPEKYYKWTRYTLRLGDIIQNPISEPRFFTKITLKEQRIPFALLLCGYIVSILLFIIEKWCYYRTIKTKSKK
ncbi:uncharacterized protein LOC113521838 isoform X2 [Galleria mellonella]|nr:uncharacterized protein LOC113521838 isoform X2 [Galleria mellonella]